MVMRTQNRDKLPNAADVLGSRSAGSKPEDRAGGLEVLRRDEQVSNVPVQDFSEVLPLICVQVTRGKEGGTRP